MTRFTPCECTSPGWCERHQCFKPEAVFHLCRRSRVHFDLMENGDTCGQAPPDSSHPPAEGPGIVRRAMNFGRAVVRHVASGFAELDDTAYQARLAICHTCDRCDVAALICRERTCGCFLKTKARWVSEACPLGKWNTPHESPVPQN